MHRTFYAGAGLAAAAGLLMGAAMKPDLGVDDRPLGPQVVAEGHGRASGPFDDGVSVYGGRIPDYVYGTDWKRVDAAPILVSPSPSPEPALREDDDVQPVRISRAEDEGPPRPRVLYPSIDGGAAAGSDLLPPPDPADGAG